MGIWENGSGSPIVDGSGAIIECDDNPCEPCDGGGFEDCEDMLSHVSSFDFDFNITLATACANLTIISCPTIQSNLTQVGVPYTHSGSGYREVVIYSLTEFCDMTFSDDYVVNASVRFYCGSGLVKPSIVFLYQVLGETSGVAPKEAEWRREFDFGDLVPGVEYAIPLISASLPGTSPCWPTVFGDAYVTVYTT